MAIFFPLLSKVQILTRVLTYSEKAEVHHGEVERPTLLNSAFGQSHAGSLPFPLSPQPLVPIQWAVESSLPVAEKEKRMAVEDNVWDP